MNGAVKEPQQRASVNECDIDVFRNAVRRTFAFLKQTTQLDDLWSKAIRLRDDAGYLLCVSELHANDPATIATFSRWRDANQSAFPGQFPITDERTAKWLRGRLLDVEDRVLFLVLDPLGRVAGHLGFANALADGTGRLEVDNVIRGEKSGPPGIMASAVRTLIEWAEEMLHPAGIFLRVFEDNEHAVAFYRRLGFVDDGRTPMRSRREGESVFWDALPAGEKGERYFLRMMYAPVRRFEGERLILTAGPSVSAREMSYTRDAARHGWNTQWNQYLTRFERAFAEYLGVKYAIATSSCTGALHIALAASGIGPGDEVIVPDLTWVATANAVLYVGATPRFVDVDSETWCLDPSLMESLINERTKAVIPVHLYGHPARADVIRDIADRHGILVIEDAAPALGAECNGRKTGTFGSFAAFSFQGAKVLVTGEGGILATDDELLYRRAYRIWDQGRQPGTFWIEENGLKYKMSNLQAAFGLGQLERIDELIAAKRRVFRQYEEGLRGVPHLRLLKEAVWARSICWMTNALVEDSSVLTRDELRAKLRERNIDTRPVFPPVSGYPMFAHANAGTPRAKRAGEHGLNLPSGVCLKPEEIDYVCRVIRELLS